MDDTAQHIGAAETDPNIASAIAADAFKAFTSEQPVERPRDESGRFASQAEEEGTDTAEPLGEVDEVDDEGSDDDDAADEAQQDVAEMPSSWGKDDAELWQSLPPEAQAKVIEREGERDRAVNQKFQEAANLRKEVQTELATANANRDAFASAIDDVLSLVTPQKPDPRQYGLGTGQYDRESYDLAVLQYEQSAQMVDSLKQQRQAIAAQQQQEYQRQEAEAYRMVEDEWRPKLTQLVPDVTDPAKSGKVLGDIVNYAVQSGIPAELFTDKDQAAKVTSAELLMAWKAMQFDRIKGAEKTVKSTPAPRPAAPVARPGVSVSRSATNARAVSKAHQRLASEGSIEAGAAVFRQIFK